MINKYDEFLLEKEFDLILELVFKITEDVQGKWTSPNRMEWDYTNTQANPNEFSDDTDFIDKTLKKLKEFLSKLPKEKIQSYFIKLFNSLKRIPERLRRFLIMHYMSVFLAVSTLSALIGYSDDKLDVDVKKEIIELTKVASFAEAQNSVKEVEAGFSNDRGDTGNFIEVPGGKRFLGTNHGISAPILFKYFKERGIKRLPTKEDMMNLKYETALEIYKKDYWDNQNLGEICNQSVANIIYDGCVNQGVDGMNSVLKDALRDNGVSIKGWCFSKRNIKQINSCNPKELFNSIKKFREVRYRQAETWDRHGEGWMNRLNSIKYNN